MTLPPHGGPAQVGSRISYPSKSQGNSPTWLPEMPHPFLCFCFPIGLLLPEPRPAPPPPPRLTSVGPLVPETFSVDVTCLFSSP